MIDESEPASSPSADEIEAQAEVLRRRADALTGRERAELLADVEAMLANLDGKSAAPRSDT